MKRRSVCILALSISMEFQLAGCTLDNSRQSDLQAPGLAILKLQAERTAEAAHKNLDDQNAYMSALDTYEEHRKATADGGEASLYSEYKTLLAMYTVAATFYWSADPGHPDPHLPLVSPATTSVTLAMIKADYVTMAHDYLDVLKYYMEGTGFNIPPPPPPLPPIPSSDKDAGTLIALQKTLAPARQQAVASRAIPKTRFTGWGPDVPLGGLHTHPGPAEQLNGWCQSSSDGAFVPC